MEDATEHWAQRSFCAVNGPAAGGGYELAVATDHILLIDDRRSTVSLPETPLLAVLPGTGGLTRVDRKSTRLNSSHANISYAVFCLKKKKSASISQSIVSPL